MTNTDEKDKLDASHPNASVIVEQFLLFLAEQRWDEWIAMWADDGVLEFPFAPPGRRSRYTGKADILTYMKAAIGKMKMDTLDYYEVYLMADPQMLCIEMGLKGHIISTGAPLHQKYISVFKTRDGKLLQYREYWNPIASMDANGGRDAWTAAFGSPAREGDNK